MVAPRRHFGEQPAETAHRLADAEVALDVPALHRHGMEHRHAQVLLQPLDDVERTPGRAEHVDRLGALWLRRNASAMKS